MIRQKTCKARGCNNKFVPFNSMQAWCSPACGYVISQEKLARKREKERISRKRENAMAKRLFLENDKKHVRKGAVAYLHKWILWRDRGLDCIACGKSLSGKKVNASHYMPAGMNSAVKFHEDNIHAGCVQCNMCKSGNLVPYRINLLKRIGSDRVEWLESQRQVKKWTIEELREIRQEYGDRLRKLDIKLPSVTH